MRRLLLAVVLVGCSHDLTALSGHGGTGGVAGATGHLGGGGAGAGGMSGGHAGIANVGAAGGGGVLGGTGGIASGGRAGGAFGGMGGQGGTLGPGGQPAATNVGGAAGTATGGGAGVGGQSTTDPDVVLWYKFDQPGGSVATDSSGHGRDGALNTTESGSTATFSTMSAAGPYSLNLTNGAYVSVPSDLASMGAAQAMTISLWFYVNSDVRWQPLFDFGSTPYQYGPVTFSLTPHGSPAGPAEGTADGLMMAISANGQFNEQVIIASPVPPVGMWHHVAVVLAAEATYTGEIYLDGVLAGNTPGMNLHPSDLGSTPSNWVGRSSYSLGDPFFNGFLDDFRIYKRALTAEEVATVQRLR